MEYIFEFLLELILDSSLEGSKNTKIPKPLRYMLFTFVCLIFFGIIGGTCFIGIICLKNSALFGSVIILISILLLTLSVIKLIKTYKKMKGLSH